MRDKNSSTAIRALFLDKLITDQRKLCKTDTLLEESQFPFHHQSTDKFQECPTLIMAFQENSTKRDRPNKRYHKSFQSPNPTNYTDLQFLGGTIVWNGTNLTIGPMSSMLISNCVPTIMPNGGSMQILENSMVTYDGDISSFNSNSSSLMVEVSGTNAQWHNQRFFTIGYSGSNNQFIVTNGASMLTTNIDNGAENPYGYSFDIGYNVGSTSNSIIVTGPGSYWNTSGGVNLGISGADNQVEILNGATANAAFYIGNSPNVSSE